MTRLESLLQHDWNIHEIVIGSSDPAYRKKSNKIQKVRAKRISFQISSLILLKFVVLCYPPSDFLIVFPSGVAQRLTNELDKRLDLDIDEELESPKLRLQLSPAELDKRLLKLYKNIVDGPRGDVLRIIGGGQEVALQDLYIKTHALRDRAKDPKNQTILSFGPFEALDDDSDDTKRTASQWVNWALRRNLPRGNVPINRSHRKSQGMKTGIAKNKDEGMTMSLFKPSPFDFRRKNLAVGITFTSANQFCPPRRSMSSFSILI